MKRLIFLLAGACAAGILSFAALYCYRAAKLPLWDKSAWLQQEFALTDAQLAEVERLEAEYRPVCDGHCRRYAEAYARLSALLQANSAWTTETQQALQTLYQIEAECHSATLKHAYEVSAVMSPEQGRRYLEMVRARLQLDGANGGVQMTR